MQIRDSVVVITGAASGMGEATARYFHAEGARVALLDRNEERLQQLKEELLCFTACVDVTEESNLKKVLQGISAELGSPRVCVQCAGILLAERILGKSGPMALDKFSKVVQVNLIGTFNVLRLVAAEMQQADEANGDHERGVVINTASVAAFEGQIGQVAYSASKGGVVALTLPAARELARFGIRVNTIAPGLMLTPMLAGLSQEARDSIAATIPFPKRLGYPEEFAQLAAHIVQNKMINGAVLRLDGALRLTEK